MRKTRYYGFLLGGLLLCIALSGCFRRDGGMAPVSNIGHRSYLSSHHYRVLAGDTLYSIAWRYGMDFRDLARLNHIKQPYAISPGQVLVTRSSSASKHSTKPKPKRATPAAKPRRVKQASRTKVQRSKPQTRVVRRDRYAASKSIHHWRWPTHGRLLRGYQTQNRGIDIGGKLQQPIYSTASGVVVYAGNGLRSYGNLLIIKHNNDYLSAYAHNAKLLVKEGQQVRAGQMIARMGRSGGKQVMLHFEIRRKGRPVNPLRYLPKS